jgi:uncharacterized lipoprotein YddW (UPF0748 family)
MKSTIATIAVCAFCVLTALPAPGIAEEQQGRGLFVSVIQDPPVLSSRSAIEALIAFAKRAGINDLFFQIYRANKAWFPSAVADSSPYEECRKKVGEDAFALLISRAHAAGIRVHGWLNLLSLSDNADAVILKKYGPEILTRNLRKKKRLADYKIDDQYFLEPGDLRVRDELAALVGEILERYPDLDGLEFDYIRYPDKHPFYGYTKSNIARFKAETGRETIEEGSAIWQDWKRRQVTELLQRLTRKARQMISRITISTTACAPYSRAYLEAFQDWPTWLRSGLAEFVTLMSYPSEAEEFEKFVADAKAHTADFSRVNVAVPAYKLVNSPETFGRQFRFCESAECRSCVVFHYGSILENPALEKTLIKK